MENWVRDLSSADVTVREEAAYELSLSGEEAAIAAVALVDASADDCDEVREFAVAALEELGVPQTGDAVLLAERLTAEHRDTAYWAATLLGRLESDAAIAVDALVVTLTEHSELSVRQRAAWALGKIGPAATAALPALQQAVTEKFPRLTQLATVAIESIRKSSSK